MKRDNLVDRDFEVRWKKFHARLVSCQKKCTAESVRKLRISLRKLVIALAAALDMADSRSGQKAIVRLKKSKKVLGELRDLQMQRQRLASLKSQDPAAGELLAWLRKKEQKQLACIGPDLCKLKVGSLQKQVGKAASKASRALAKRQETREALWRRALIKSFRQVKRRYQALDQRDLETIHDLRIAFKRLRFLKEASACKPKEMAALKAYQDKMGAVQDWEVLLNTIHRYANRKGTGTFRKLTPLRKSVLRQRDLAVGEFWKVRDDVLQWKGEAA
jgi:CHAD domain-containing protein